MKRSEINDIMCEAMAFFDRHHFKLPPFAFWSPDDWRNKGPEAADIVRQQLGWDITDFGCGDFDRKGLFLFTLRNGLPGDLANPHGKPYAEKIMIVKENQLTPCHCHNQKMEDIINRGGGELVVQLWNDGPDGRLGDGDITVSLDSVRITVPAGGKVRLRPGESVCLPPRLWHAFWAEPGKGDVLVGEVSRVNDDHTDNCFFDPIGRFPNVEEDVEPLHLLVGDYPNYYPHA